MPNPESKDAQVGPYTETKTTTLKFTPFELTLVNKTESTHVPRPCHCHEQGNDRSNDVMETIFRAAQAAQAAASARAATPPANEPADQPDEPAAYEPANER